MFANLKKKLEEEVGDLSKLTSPINFSGALGDRRVTQGGSTQGTNTPSNLGSRQSSVASLIDITPERPSTQNRLHPSSSNQSLQAVREANQEEVQQLKKANTDLKGKLENLQKSFEEKLQNQEADFAWKYNAKEDELSQLRSERDRLRDQVRSTETNWQEKYMRVATELENLEGLSKQENAKVKHLLLNTQNDLQAALVKISQLESESKNKRDRENANLWLATEGQTNQETNRRLSNEEQSMENEKKVNDIHHNLVHEIEKLKSEKEEEIQALTKRNQELISEIQTLKTSASVSSSEITSFQSRIKQLEDWLQKQTQENQQKLSKSDAQVEAVSQLLAKQEALTASESDKCLQMRRDLDEVKSHLAESKAQVIILQDEQGSLKSRLEEVNVLKELEEVEKNKLADRCSDLLKQVSELKKITEDHSKVDELLTVKTQNEEEIKSLTCKNQELQNRLLQLKTSESASCSQIEFLQSRIKELEDSFKKQNEESMEKISSATSQLQELRDKVALAEEDKRKAIDRNAELNNEIAHLREVTENKTQLDDLSAITSKNEEEMRSLVTNNEELQKEIQNLVTKNKELQTNVKDLATKNQQLQKEITALRSTTSASDSEVASLQLRISELDAMLQQQNEASISKVAQVTKQLESVREQLIIQEGLTKSESDNCLQLKRDLEGVQLTLTEKTNQLSSFQSERDSLSNQLEQTQSQLEQSNNELVALQNEKISLATQLEQWKATLKESKAQVVTLQNQVDSLSMQLEQLNSQYSERESLVVKLKAEKDSMVLQLEQVNAQRDAAEKQKKIAEDQCTALRKETAELKESAVNQSILDEYNTIKIQNEEEIRILTNKNQELQSDMSSLKASASASGSELASLKSRINELEDMLQRQSDESEQKVAEATSEVESLREELGKQEIRTNAELDKYLQLRRDLDEVQSQLAECKTQVIKLQDEKDSLASQIEEMSVHKDLAEEEAKNAMDRNSELYSEVTELKKSLRTSRQQLSELKKSLNKESKNDVSNTPINPGASANLTQMEEVSLRDTHHDGNPPYSDVNFLYLRSVIFKYLTASDPQVAASLVRVVATLLELKPEEEKQLRETQHSHASWVNSLIKK